MENNMEQKQKSPLSLEQAKFLRRTKYGLDALCCILFIGMMLSIFYIIRNVAKNDAVIFETSFNAVFVFFVMALIGLLIGDVMAQRIDRFCSCYYCKKCGHIHLPSLKDTNDTRLRKCPNCNQRSWHKKLLQGEQ